MSAQHQNERFGPQKNIIRSYLLDSNIQFQENFRIFPLHSNGQDLEYVPQFYLCSIKHKNKRILIEVNTKPKPADIAKFRFFLDIYGRLYHLIMVVDNTHIRQWNNYDNGVQAVFHDIWTIGSAEFLIQHLKSLDEGT